MSQQVREAAIIAASGAGVAAVLYAIGPESMSPVIAVIGLGVLLALGLVCLWPRPDASPKITPPQRRRPRRDVAPAKPPQPRSDSGSRPKRARR